MAQVGAGQPVSATAGTKRVKFDDDLVLDDGDYDENKADTPAAAAAAAGKSGEEDSEYSEKGAEVLEHGRVIEYVVPKLEGKLPSAGQLGAIAADIINDNWGDSGGLIKLASAQTQYHERSKEMVPRGLARYIRLPFNNLWEMAKYKEVHEGVLRLTAEKPETFMSKHEKTTLGVLLKGSNQGAMVLYISNVLMCAFEGNLNIFQNWSDVFFNYVDNNFDLSAANGREFNNAILMLGGISFSEFRACVGFFHESHKKYKKFEHVEHLLKVVGSRVVPTNETSYGAKGFIDSGVLVAKQFIWVVSEELEYSEMWDEGSIGANVIYTEFGEACVLEVMPDNRGLRGSGVMKLQIDVPLARANDFKVKSIELAVGAKKRKYGKTSPVHVQFFLNEAKARECTGQLMAGKKDEKGKVISQGASAQGGAGLSLEKMKEMAEVQAAAFRKDMAERDKATNDKIDKISTAQQSFFEQQKEHERTAEEREAAAAARQAQSEALAQQVQQQVGQIALSMNGLAGAIAGAGGLVLNGPDANAQKQIKESWCALEPAVAQLMACAHSGEEEILAEALLRLGRCVERLLAMPLCSGAARDGVECAAVQSRPEAGGASPASQAAIGHLMGAARALLQSQGLSGGRLWRRYFVNGAVDYEAPRELPPPEPPPILPPPEPPPSASGQKSSCTRSGDRRAEGERRRGRANCGRSRWSSSGPACGTWSGRTFVVIDVGLRGGLVGWAVGAEVRSCRARVVFLSVVLYLVGIRVKGEWRGTWYAVTFCDQRDRRQRLMPKYDSRDHTAILGNSAAPGNLPSRPTCWPSEHGGDGGCCCRASAGVEATGGRRGVPAEGADALARNGGQAAAVGAGGCRGEQRQ